VVGYWLENKTQLLTKKNHDSYTSVHFIKLSNRIEKSIRQRESNRIEFFSPESECSTCRHNIFPGDGFPFSALTLLVG